MAVAQSFVFAELSGTPINTNGWNLQGAARIGNTGTNTGNGELILVEPITFSSGSVFYNTPINLSRCKNWIAQFDFRIADGNAADGLAFCYLEVPPSGFVNGSGLGIPQTANGLKVCLDTWRNCGTDAVPKIQIRYGSGYDECWQQPTRNNNDGLLGFIRDGNYHTCRIVYDDGTIKVSIDGVEYLTGQQTFDFTGFFGFTASTGGNWDRHSIRNVRIFTQMPPSEAGVPASLCGLGKTTLGTSANPDYSYNWTPAIGLSNPAVSNPELTVPANNGDVQVLTYYVETAFKTIPGCFSRDSVAITVLPSARPAFGFDSVCQPNTAVSMVNQTLYRNQPAPAAGLSWNWTAERVGGGPIQTSTSFEPVFQFTGSQPYRIRLNAVSPDGCVADTSQLVPGIFPVPEFAIDGPNQVCQNVVFPFTSSLTNQSVAAAWWFWDFGDGNTSTVPNPLHVYNTPGMYTVKLVAGSGQGCIADTVTKTVIHLANPDITNISGPRSGCITETFAYEAVMAQPGSYQYRWYEGNRLVGNSSQYTLTNPRAGSTFLRLAASNVSGCSDSVVLDAISIFALPTIDAGPDRQIIAGNSIRLLATAASPNYTFQWQPGSSLDNPALLQPLAAPVADQRYLLLASDSNGCQAGDTMLVKVFPTLRIPNAFSPNGDGINDQWIMPGLNTYDGVTVRVFDRYGKPVFASTGYNIPWDGTRQGSPLPSGTYYYIIDLKNGFGAQNGSITLLR